MFVKSNMEKDKKYYKSTGAIILKANTITYVDDNLVTAKELKDCYGDRITIMSQEKVNKYMGELAEKANTGSKEVDDFLNGETEKLPEGTEEIDEAEALRLKAEEDKKAEEARIQAEKEAEAARLKAEALEKAEQERIAKEKEMKKKEDEALANLVQEITGNTEAPKAEEVKVEAPKKAATKKSTSTKSKGKASSKKK